MDFRYLGIAHSQKTPGRAGRELGSTGPPEGEIARYLATDTLEPIRIYVGLNAAETARVRAMPAIGKMKSVSVFDRSVLVIVTPDHPSSWPPGFPAGSLWSPWAV